MIKEVSEEGASSFKTSPPHHNHHHLFFVFAMHVIFIFCQQYHPHNGGMDKKGSAGGKVWVNFQNKERGWTRRHIVIIIVAIPISVTIIITNDTMLIRRRRMTGGAAQSGATFGVCGIRVGASSSFTLIWQLPHPNTRQTFLSQIGKKELAEDLNRNHNFSSSSSFRNYITTEYLGAAFPVGHFSGKSTSWLKVPHLH